MLPRTRFGESPGPALLDAEQTPDLEVSGGSVTCPRRVLAIDNDPAITAIVKHGLGEFAFEVETEDSGRLAIDRLQFERFDALIVDLRLGVVSGLEILRCLRVHDQRTAVLLVSGIRDQQVAVVAMQDGADDFISKPFRIEQLRERLEQAIIRRGKFADRLDEQRRLTEELRVTNVELLRRENELESLSIRSIRSLVLSLEAKDPYTKDHSIKVALLSVKIARQLNYDENGLREVRLAGLLHDVGKIGIKEGVLNKPGRLDEEELTHMRLHPIIGARILLPVSHRFPQVVDAVRYEHERFDGSGYPAGIRGTEIPQMARIIAVADCYDAITSNRPYRSAQAREFAAREIAGGSGTQFDPDVVQAFLELIPTL